MPEPDTAALVKQVRDYLESHKRVVDLPDERFEYETPPSARPAIVAFATIVERLEVAERERDELWEFNQKLAADHYFARAEAAEAEVERLREALTLTYASIDNLCARPGTCMAVRPRAALRGTASGK